MKKNSLYISEMGSRMSKKSLRNYILKIVSEYKDTSKMLSCDVLARIYMDALFYKEENYIRHLIKKCKKNMPTEYLKLFEEYISENRYSKDDVQVDESNTINNETEVDATFTYEEEVIYSDKDLSKLYSFNYVVRETDTFDSLCQKFNLIPDIQNIQLKELIEGNSIILITSDEFMAKYQQIIFEYLSSSKYSKNK